jgi:DNA polymerase-3 subunit gamma/tau
MRVLSRMWQMLLKGITEVQAATRPAAAAEMVLVRIAYVADLPTPDEAIKMLEQNGGGSPVVSNGSAARSAPAAPVASAAPVRMPTSSPSSFGGGGAARPQMAAPSPASDPQGAAPALRVTSFTQLVALAGQRRDLMIKGALEGDMRLVRFEEGRLEVALEPNASKTMISDLARKFELWTGRRWTVIVSNEQGQPTLRSVNQAAKQEHARTAEADPRVREVLSRFPGAKVVEVRRLAPEAPESDINADYGSDDPPDGSDGDDL